VRSGIDKQERMRDSSHSFRPALKVLGQIVRSDHVIIEELDVATFDVDR